MWAHSCRTKDLQPRKQLLQLDAHMTYLRCDEKKINSNWREWNPFQMTWRWQANRWDSSMIGNNCAHANQCNIILTRNQLKFGMHDDARYAQYCGCYIWIAAIVNAQLNFDVVRWKSLLRKKTLVKYSYERHISGIDITQSMWWPLRWRSGHSKVLLQLARGLWQWFVPTMEIHMDANRFRQAYEYVGLEFHILHEEAKRKKRLIWISVSRFYSIGLTAIARSYIGRGSEENLKEIRLKTKVELNDYFFFE